MRILYIDRDANHAREVYAQVLSYRGVPWDMLHCETIVEAAAWLDRDQFDLILLAAYCQDQASEAWDGFIQRHTDTPIVVISDSDHVRDHVRFIALGANDCLAAHVVDGPFLMRRLRLAASRFHCTKKIDPQRLLELPARSNHGAAGASLGSEGHDAAPADPGDETAVTATLAPPQTTSDLDGLPRILLIDDCSTQTLFGFEDTDQFRYVTVESFEAARQTLEQTPCAAVISEQGVIEREGYEELRQLLDQLVGVPMIMVMVDRSTSAAVAFVDQGVDDCEIAVATNQLALERTLQLSLARAERDLGRLRDRAAALGAPSDRRSSARGGRDRREATRYLCSHPVIAIPILPNGAPDKSHVTEAVATDVSAGGVGLEVNTSRVLPSRNWMIGIRGLNEAGHEYELHYAAVSVRNVSYIDGGIRMGTAFQHPSDDLLRPENLQPRLNPETGQLLPDLPLQILDDWCEVGVMRRVVMERVLSCPECSGVAAIGSGCRECGSARFEFENLIHHFACAYFGREEEFQSDDGIACPKCRLNHLVAGVDFELIKARYQCEDCGFESNELEQVCNCLHCLLKFPIRMAREQRVYGYDVHRLDILDYLSSAK